MTMSVQVDTTVDAAYVRLSDNVTASTSQFSDDLIVDLDEFGMVTGVEVLDITCELPVTELKNRYHLSDDAVEMLRRLRPSIARMTAESSTANRSNAVKASGSHFTAA